MAINLKTVIAELQFIDQLVTDDNTDSRLPDLLENAKLDLATAAVNAMSDDPIISGLGQ